MLLKNCLCRVWLHVFFRISEIYSDSQLHTLHALDHDNTLAPTKTVLNPIENCDINRSDRTSSASHWKENTGRLER